MGIMTIDLGTTNIKVASYTRDLKLIALESRTVSYLREGGFIEFDAEHYFGEIVDLMSTCLARSQAVAAWQPEQLVLTGQAESLVVTDAQGNPVRNGISWLDMRSGRECEELSARFDRASCYRITGQPEIIPTWPLTKILWLKRNEPECFAGIGKFLLLKDYVIFRLTGRFVGEHSIYPFSCYFNLVTKQYWSEPLDYCGVRPDQLPELVEPCSLVGELLPTIRQQTGLSRGCIVNAGTLDHFAGMIGTGNIMPGIVSESAGTVSSIATFVGDPFAVDTRVPVYCGPFDDSYVFLPVCESGGISLEWFRDRFTPDLSFQAIDLTCGAREMDPRLVFLPYLTGVNPPEFDPHAAGVFFGAQIGHDRHDFALSIMYGVACLLRKNIDNLKSAGVPFEKIVSTGGGAKSRLWAQIKANICRLPVAVPAQAEAPTLGAALIGALSCGYFASYEDAVRQCVEIDHVCEPDLSNPAFEAHYTLFVDLYSALTPIFSRSPRKV